MDNTTRINHNNSGHKYRIAVDIAKEGSHIWDLTPYFKGRVGDNNFGLQVTWYYQGQLMNVVGMKPYIEGLVGQYSFGKNGEIDMDPDAVPVRYDGSPDDCEEAGKATFYFPSQMFPKEGIFKGFIGVKDDRDGSRNPQISGVTIWFKVLPGIAQMGHACDAYVDELDKALQNFKDKLDNHDKDYQSRLQKVIDDARNTYLNEVKNAHDSLDALNSQIQANRDEQKNLSDRLAGTEQQIQIHDVVTRPEFNDLSNQLTQQVAQMKESGLEFFNNADDLKAKYPQGANKLCVTLNDSHEWIYDYSNARWNDAGTFNYGTIDPKLQNAFYRNGLDNLVSNSNLDTLDGWGAYCANGNKPNITIRNGVKSNGANIIRTIGYWDNAHPDKSYTWIESSHFAIDSNKPVSYGAVVNFNSLIPTSGGEAQLQTVFYDDAGNRRGQDFIRIPSKKTDKLHIIFRENILPRGATRISFVFGIQGPGYLDITQPFIYEGAKINYSSGNLEKNIAFNSSNLLLTNSVFDWNYLSTDHIDIDNMLSYHGDPTLKISNADINNKSFHIARSQYIKIKNNQYYVITLPAKVHVDHSQNSKAYLSVYQYDSDLNQVAYNDFVLTNCNDIEKHSFIFKTSDKTQSILVMTSISGLATLNISNPKIEEYKINSNFYCEPNCFYAESDSVQLNSNTIDIYGKDANEFIIARTTEIPVKAGLKKVSFDVKAKIELLNNVAKAYLTVAMFDKNNKQIDFQDLILSADTGLNHFELSISEDVEKVQIMVSAYNSVKYHLEWVHCSLGLDAKLSTIAVNTKDRYNPLTNWPVYNWIFPTTGKVTRDDNYLYNAHPTLKINVDNKALTEWTFGKTPELKREKLQEINLKLTYQANYNDKSGGAYLTLRQTDKSGKVVANDDIKLAQSNTWTTKEVDNFSLNPNAEFIQFIISINGNGFIRAGELQWIDKFSTKLNESQSIPQLEISANSTQISNSWTTAPFKYQDGNRRLMGYLQFGIQGNSSKAYPKKNLKLKFYEDSQCKKKLKWQPKSSWTSNFKFNAKANWIDATQSRNLVNAHMFKEAAAITPIANKEVAENLMTSQSLGQMEGFPIEISMNDGYYGLFTFNTKKDDKTFGMDSDNPDHECITTENSELGFHLNQGFDAQNYGTELHDKPSDKLKKNLDSFEKFINSSTDDDFKVKIGSYIDINSVINLYLYGLLSSEWDFQNKSQLLLTWNGGQYFYMIPYDLDSTWKLYWSGSHLNTDFEQANFALDNKATYVNMSGKNLLLHRIYVLMKPEIKAQYKKLRSSVWRNDQIIDAFKNFIDSIPKEVYERDQNRWPDIPSKKITDFAQIQQSVIERGNAMDKFIESLVPETDPIQNLQSQINQLKNGTPQK